MSCMGRTSRSWRRRRSSTDIIPLCQDELDCLPSTAQQMQERQRQWHRRLSPIKRLPQLGRVGSFASSSSPSRKSPTKEQQRDEKSRKTVQQQVVQPQHEQRQQHQQQQERQEQRHCSPTAKKYAAEKKHRPTTLMNGYHHQQQQETEKNGGEKGPIPSLGPPHFFTSPIPPLASPYAVVEMADAKHNHHQQQHSPCSPSGPETAMSTSILASPAWYRDREGRTGYRPDNFPLDAHLQSTPIKQNQHNDRHTGEAQTAPTSYIPLSARHIPPQRYHFPSSTLPVRSNGHHSAAGVHLAAPPSSGGLFPLRRTENTAELAENGWRRNGTSGRQKFVKFAETVQINEIAPRDDHSQASSCSSASNSFSSSSSSSSSLSAPSCSHSSSASSAEEGARNGGRRQPAQNKTAATRLPQPAIHKAVATYKLANGGVESAPRMLKASIRETASTFKVAKATAVIRPTTSEKVVPSSYATDTADLERVIEQFFRHCQSISALGPAEQQRSIYDNLSGDIAAHQQTSVSVPADEWLHTKAKVLAQRQTEHNGCWEGGGGAAKKTAAKSCSAEPLSRIPLLRTAHKAQQQRGDCGQSSSDSSSSATTTTSGASSSSRRTTAQMGASRTNGRPPLPSAMVRSRSRF